ncbi:hypothetical protein ACO0K9_10505 [Undibacterium sp. Ji50W]|uniref:hypothetical protein n=1 Tax=Undibacterium sp. Ji50W TaxID=3413041 RepID=UPI003BF047AE
MQDIGVENKIGAICADFILTYCFASKLKLVNYFAGAAFTSSVFAAFFALTCFTCFTAFFSTAGAGAGAAADADALAEATGGTAVFAGSAGVLANAVPMAKVAATRVAISLFILNPVLWLISLT